MTSILVLALVTAVVSALRSTWSPCGASVLSTITPLTERSRGNRWGTTAAAYVVGAVLAGLAVGAGAAVASLAAGLLDAPVALGAAAALALVAAGLDVAKGGRALPPYTRQLNENDPNVYRSWVYGGWWGVQVGSGFATISMTAGVYLTFALAALTGSPLAALLVGLVFGLGRGLAVVPARTLADPDALRAFHRRKAELDEPTRRLTVATLVAVVPVAGALAAGSPALVAAAAALVVGAIAFLVAGRAGAPEPTPAAPAAALAA